jgi:EmrB/QacA subfamily drug resistance transporter
MSATRTPVDRRWLALGVLNLSLLLVVVDNTILNVALPTLVDELDASTSDLQWIVDSYVLVFAGLLLTAGSLGDRFGRRRSLFAGMGIFGIGSVLAALSGSSAALIATRALMGLGAAFVMPATLSIITNLFTDPKERARAIAAWAGVAGLGVAIGPITGGWLLEHFWWGSVFLVNVPFIVLALVAGRRLLPESRDPEQPRLDLVGAGLSIVGLTALVWTLIEAPSHGWTDAATLGGLAASAAVLGAFLAWERRTDHPMLNLGFFADRRFSVGTGSITLVMFAMFGSLFVLTQLLQFVFGYSALEAGIRMLPIAGTMVIVAPSSATLVERLGTKLVVGTGMAIVAVGLVLTSGLSPADGYGPVAVAKVVLAMGMALVMAPATEAIMGSLPPAKAGVGSAVNDTTRELGGALGVAVLGSILSSAYAANVAAGLEGTPAPEEVRTAAGESLGAAIAIANQIGGDAGQRLTALAQQGFLDAMGTSLLVAAAVAGVGSILTYVFLPSRSTAAATAATAATGEPKALDVDVVLAPGAMLDVA